MKRLYLLMLSVFVSASALWAQQGTGEFSGSYTGKIKYPSGKNVYLMDGYKFDCRYKVAVGEPYCIAKVNWTRGNSFMVGGKKMTYAQLSEYPDLKMRYDLITPASVEFKYTMMLYSKRSNAYIASMTSSVTVPMVEKAGNIVAIPTTPVKCKWRENFNDLVVGKQTLENPGHIMMDATLDEFFKASNITKGKINKTDPNNVYWRSLRNLFYAADSMSLVKVTANVNWRDSDYKYIVDEYNRRKQCEKTLAAKDTVKAFRDYFDGRYSYPSISEKSPFFWNSTVSSVESWMHAIKEGDSLYAQSRWAEARGLYQRAVNKNPDLIYAEERVAKIDKYLEYRAARSVGSIELVRVQGRGSVKSFYMGKTEVTQRQWRHVMRAASPSKYVGSNRPVESVSWEDVQTFLEELNRQTGMHFRLPRVEEWEYVAHGGFNALNTEYSGSDNLDEVAWCAYNSQETSHEVGLKTPNEAGVYDMTGNVAEWTSDAFDKTSRFVKGGSWADDATECSMNKRDKFPIKFKSDRIGFRVCQDE